MRQIKLYTVISTSIVKYMTEEGRKYESWDDSNKSIYINDIMCSISMSWEFNETIHIRYLSSTSITRVWADKYYRPTRIVITYNGATTEIEFMKKGRLIKAIQHTYKNRFRINISYNSRGDTIEYRTTVSAL